MGKNINESLVIVIALILICTIISYNELSADTKSYKKHSDLTTEVRQPDDTYAYSSDTNSNIVANSALRAQTVYSR